MIEFSSVTHPIQKHIIDVLLNQKIVRFRDLRPERVDTNLCTYHINSLIKQGMVQKMAGGYTLGPIGMSYVDRINVAEGTVRTQPNIVTMFVVQNSDGDILLQKRTTQPYIDTWTLPQHQFHIDDASVLEAAQRVSAAMLAGDTAGLVHAGDCYIRVYAGKVPISHTLAHVFRLYRDDIVLGEDLMWARPHKLYALPLAPGVEEVMTRTFFKDPFYFEEFTVNYSAVDEPSHQ